VMYMLLIEIENAYYFSLVIYKSIYVIIVEFEVVSWSAGNCYRDFPFKS
jgi:hypothetical protein